MDFRNSTTPWHPSFISDDVLALRAWSSASCKALLLYCPQRKQQISTSFLYNFKSNSEYYGHQHDVSLHLPHYMYRLNLMELLKSVVPKCDKESVYFKHTIYKDNCYPKLFWYSSETRSEVTKRYKMLKTKCTALVQLPQLQTHKYKYETRIKSIIDPKLEDCCGQTPTWENIHPRQLE